MSNLGNTGFPSKYAILVVNIFLFVWKSDHNLLIYLPKILIGYTGIFLASSNNLVGDFYREILISEQGWFPMPIL